jgi:hypothetical protein
MVVRILIFHIVEDAQCVDTTWLRTVFITNFKHDDVAMELFHVFMTICHVARPQAFLKVYCFYTSMVQMLYVGCLEAQFH